MKTTTPQHCRLRRRLLATAMSLALSSGAVHAQSTVGSIFGEAGAGSTVTIENLDTGTSRQITADAQGRFTFGQLPTGRYRVSADGVTREAVVQVGTGTNVDLVAAELEAVTITGTATTPIDVSSVETTTIYTAEQLQKLPVARDISSVALLAPGTVRGDVGFNVDASLFPSETPLASFGGSSVAENGYYINGFDVTNVRDFLSYATLPFGAVAEQQVKTGGYGAEFGRSLGGVINLVTKRGTNEWQFGGAVYYSPDWGHASDRDVINRDTGEGAAEFYQYRSANEMTSATMEVFGGGALIEDRLFMFGIIEAPYLSQDRYDRHDSVSRKNTQPRGMVKLDWNITDDHLLEFTGISHTYKYRETAFLNPDHEEFTGEHGIPGVESETERGAEVYIARYTGYLTDTFTLSALGGYLNYVNDYRTPEAWPRATECPRVWDSRANPNELVYRGCWDQTQLSYLRTPGFGPDEDTRKSFRVDADWMIGDHLLRFGYDRASFESKAAGNTLIGPNGLYYRYFNTDTLPLEGLPAGTDYVRTWYDIQSGGAYEQVNTAFYVEDTWQVTDNFVAYLGLRQETFDNRGGNGDTFIENDDLFGPRLGFSWDVRGDSSWKVFANAGRYFLPIATNTNIRATRVEYFEENYWTFTGIDPATYMPTGLTLVDGPYVNGSDEPADPRTIADQDLDPMYQDEYILGTQFALGGNWSMGVRGIHRSVQSGIEDFCGHNAFNEWAQDNGYDADFATDGEGIDMAGCLILNPGQDVTIAMDPDNDGDLEDFTVSNSYLGLPEYTRNYRAIELTVEKSFADNWAFQGSYTWSKSYGNVEGSVNSTLEQEDPGATQDFDYLAFTLGTDGYLPNDRRHSFKFNGVYQLSDEWRIGSTAFIQSGRPVNCNGYIPVDQLGIEDPDGGSISAYSSSSFYCPDREAGEMVLTRRGEFGRTPWTWELDLNVAYTPAWANQQLTLQLDVFNLLNNDKVTEYNETSQLIRPTAANPAPIDANFLNDRNYQQPRSIRLSARYDW